MEYDPLETCGTIVRTLRPRPVPRKLICRVTPVLPQFYRDSVDETER